MRRLFLSFVILIAVLFTFNEVFAAIKVIKVKGSVAYKYGKRWAPLKSGMKIKEGTKISTGVRSMAILKLNNSRVKIRQLTMMKIYNDSRTGNKSRTNIGLKYGSINARVNKIKKLKTVFKIHTPVATSSVRGTEQNVFYGARAGILIQVIHGMIEANSNNGIHKYISGNTSYQHKVGKAVIENILSNIKNGALIRIYSQYMTDDEKFFNAIFGDDTIDNGDVLRDYLRGVSGKTTVNIKLQWPNK